MCPGGLAPNACCQNRCSSVRSRSDPTHPKRPFGLVKTGLNTEAGGLECWRIYINSGDLMLQSPLPPERELCLEFSIGRMRARHALNVLEDTGPVYREFTRGTFVYFCDPASRWQGGSNENTNGMLRQYFPKGQTSAFIARTPQCCRHRTQPATTRNPRMADLHGAPR